MLIMGEKRGENPAERRLNLIKVDWHLGGDLKTIKCMMGCAQGATSRWPCPYCNAQIDIPRQKKTNGKGIQKVGSVGKDALKGPKKGKKQQEDAVDPTESTNEMKMRNNQMQDGWKVSCLVIC